MLLTRAGLTAQLCDARQSTPPLETVSGRIADPVRNKLHCSDTWPKARRRPAFASSQSPVVIGEWRRLVRAVSLFGRPCPEAHRRSHATHSVLLTSLGYLFGSSWQPGHHRCLGRDSGPSEAKRHHGLQPLRGRGAPLLDVRLVRRNGRPGHLRLVLAPARFEGRSHSGARMLRLGTRARQRRRAPDEGIDAGDLVPPQVARTVLAGRDDPAAAQRRRAGPVGLLGDATRLAASSLVRRALSTLPLPPYCNRVFVLGTAAVPSGQAHDREDARGQVRQREGLAGPRNVDPLRSCGMLTCQSP